MKRKLEIPWDSDLVLFPFIYCADNTCFYDHVLPHAGPESNMGN